MVFDVAVGESNTVLTLFNEWISRWIFIFHWNVVICIKYCWLWHVNQKITKVYDRIFFIPKTHEDMTHFLSKSLFIWVVHHLTFFLVKREFKRLIHTPKWKEKKKPIQDIQALWLTKYTFCIDKYTNTYTLIRHSNASRSLLGLFIHSVSQPTYALHYIEHTQISKYNLKCKVLQEENTNHRRHMSI